MPAANPCYSLVEGMYWKDVDDDGSGVGRGCRGS